MNIIRSIQSPSKTTILWFILICFFGQAKSQIVKPFNLLPDFGGIDGAGSAYHVYPDTDFIYVIGNTDTSFYGSLTRPYLARFDYEGHLLNYNTIFDSTSNKYIVLDELPMIKESNGFTMLVDRWNNVGSPYTDLIEFNTINGRIVRKKKLPLPPNNNFYPDYGLYYKTPDGRYIISGYIGDEADLYFAKLDSSFTLISDFIVPAINRWNWTGYLNEQADGSLILAGYSTLFPDGIIQPFLMHVSPTGEMIDFTVAPDSMKTTFSFPISTVLKDEQGNWVFSSVMDSTSFGCDTCSTELPFICAITSDFDSLLWISYLDLPVLQNENNSLVFFLTEAKDHSGFVSTVNKIVGSGNVTYLSKVSPEGDNLWTRSIAPLGWENQDPKQMEVLQLAATPYNTFVGVGIVEDQNGPNRPWLFQLDSIGCLVPGCDQTVSFKEFLEAASKDFILYPNPATDVLYILYQGSNATQSEFHIILTTIDGKKISTTSMHPVKLEQFILPIQHIPAGQYILSIENADRTYQQSEVIVKQE
jgi:hypothetical protein